MQGEDNMLIRIHSSQVPQIWETIKFVALQTDNVEQEYQAVYLLDLLQDLLANKKICYIGKDESEKITFMLIITFKIDSITQENFLYLSNLYAFKNQDDELWRQAFTDVTIIAQAAKCKKIIGESNNDRIDQIGHQNGIQCVSKKYEYII
jgi:hypothetical protein